MKSVFALLGCLLLFVSTAPFSQADLSEGLVAYWPLDNDTKDAGDHDGILKSGAVLVDDPERGKVLDVSPNNGTAFMEVAHADDIGFVDPATRTFAISLWAKPADLPRTGWTTVFSKNRPISPADTIYGIWISPSNNWHFRVDGVAGDSTAQATEEWHHLALRHEAGGNLHGFVDGQLVFERPAATGNVGAIELLIGASDKKRI